MFPFAFLNTSKSKLSLPNVITRPTGFLPGRIARIITNIISGFIIATLLLGCTASSTPTQFYLLNPITINEPVTPATTKSPTLGIGPVTLPKYLDRPEIVSRVGPNRLKIDEFHLWAGPLKDNIQFAIAENLSLLVPNNGVTLFPWKKSDGVTLRISITIRRFDIDQSQATLVADWTQGHSDRLATLSSHRSNINVPVAANDYPAKVSALNQALEEFSKEIAASIR